MDFIHIEQLHILGFTTPIRLMIIVCIVYLLGFLLLRPFIRFFMLKRYMVLLTYIIASNVALIGTLTYINMSGSTLMLTASLLAIVLLGLLLSLFSFVRAIVLFVRRKLSH